MSGRNLESFLEDASAFDALTDTDKARLFAGESLEGETNTGLPVEENSESPAADPVDTPQEGTQAPVDPVVLAKDGQHTIPFSELESARERTRQLEQELQSLKSASQAPAAPVIEPVPVADANVELLALMKEQNEALVMTDTDKAAEIGMKILAIQQDLSDRRAMAAVEARESQKQAQADQNSALTDAQARASALTEKYPFLNPQGAATNQDAIDLVVAQRDRLMSQGVSFADAIEQAVAKVAPLFDTTTTKPTAADVAQKAADAISKAKAQVPTSLSQVPAGAAAHHDESEAIRNMDMNRLSRSLENKSPEEIMKLMSKVL